ncbi:MAG: hypothetical protein F4021_06960 [Acidimicrobiales bacterium]|nr:hypothetical protein [Acidimicrobiales bacterium]MYK71420.1 hypothetical protein [Acidimicrobiales bacterium]
MVEPNGIGSDANEQDANARRFRALVTVAAVAAVTTAAVWLVTTLTGPDAESGHRADSHFDLDADRALLPRRSYSDEEPDHSWEVNTYGGQTLHVRVCYAGRVEFATDVCSWVSVNAPDTDPLGSFNTRIRGAGH